MVLTSVAMLTGRSSPVRTLGSLVSFSEAEKAKFPLLGASQSLVGGAERRALCRGMSAAAESAGPTRSFGGDAWRSAYDRTERDCRAAGRRYPLISMISSAGRARGIIGTLARCRGTVRQADVKAVDGTLCFFVEVKARVGRNRDRIRWQCSER